MKSILIKKGVSEFIGTFGIVFAGCGSIMVNERFPGMLNPQLIPAAFGLMVMAMIYSLGHISGAHFNPAVTLAFALSRHFPFKQLPAYWLAQYAGAISAILLLKTILPGGVNFGMTLPKIELLSALGWEIILTFFLMFVIISVATDDRAIGTMAGLAIGSTVAVAAYVGGPLTGASLNPARSLAPALFAFDFQAYWVYWLGPTVGAIVAALLYEWIRCDGTPIESGQKKAKGGC